jgi:hypothetical protein
VSVFSLHEVGGTQVNIIEFRTESGTKYAVDTFDKTFTCYSKVPVRNNPRASFFCEYSYDDISPVVIGSRVVVNLSDGRTLTTSVVKEILS